MEKENVKSEVTKNFIELIIDKDLEEGRFDHVQTRFPPEPNGYLHIGHAKSILLNYGLAKKYNGKFNMRFDDTNPTKEKTEFVESILKAIKWLGADWEDRLFFASNYFDQMYEAAVKLIKKGKEYVVQELTDPRRNIASSVVLLNGELPLVSVRLTKPVPKAKIFDVMDIIKGIKLEAPVEVGDVVVKNIMGYDSDLIVTKQVGVK